MTSDPVTVPALLQVLIDGPGNGTNTAGAQRAAAAATGLQDFASQFLGALEQYARALHQACGTPPGRDGAPPDKAPELSDTARRNAVLGVLADQTLTNGQKYQIIADSGVTAQDVERYAGWPPGAAAAHLREIEGVTSAGQVLEGIKSGRWTAEQGATLLQGIGGSAQERLAFGRDASEYFVNKLLGSEETDQASWHGRLSTAGIWDALVLGNMTSADAIQSSQARVSQVVMNLPGLGASESGSGVLQDFSRAELLANVDVAAAQSVDAKVWMETHDGVPPKLSSDQLQDFLASYNAPVPEELQFLLHLPAAPGVGRGLGYRNPAESQLADGLRDLASGAGRLLGIS